MLRCASSGRVKTYHSNVAEQHRALRVDAQGFLKVDLSQVKLLLFVVNHSQTIPARAHTHTMKKIKNDHYGFLKKKKKLVSVSMSVEQECGPQTAHYGVQEISAFFLNDEEKAAVTIKTRCVTSLSKTVV